MVSIDNNIQLHFVLCSFLFFRECTVISCYTYGGSFNQEPLSSIGARRGVTTWIIAGKQVLLTLVIEVKWLSVQLCLGHTSNS